MKLTVEDINNIAREAGNAMAEVREYAPWGTSHIGVVGDSSDFQEVLKELREYYPETEAKLGKWQCDGVGLSEVWYWPLELEPDAVERLLEIEESYR